jgi:hypothetical protein
MVSCDATFAIRRIVVIATDERALHAQSPSLLLLDDLVRD